MLCFAQYAFSQAPPSAEAFGFENIPEADQQQVAQQAAAENEKMAQDKEFAIADRLTLEYRTTLERYRFYEVVVLALLAVISLFVVLSFIRSSTQFQPRDMVHATGLVLVVFSTIIVILLADVEVQLTAAMGVLGGIAGFLFGSFNNSVRSERKPASPSNNDGDN
jgi:hypothetical protein